LPPTSTTPTLPDKVSLGGLETKWDAEWARGGVYRFDRSKRRAEIYAIDTPPPTVSGSLHLGSAFGYIQTDSIARFHRMRGQEIYYPMGWDDNGLPTERRVQNYFGVRCDPSVPYDPQFVPAPNAKGQPISRQNFIELCHRLTLEDEQVFERVWRMLGLSVDWTLTYATIGDRARKVAQAAFLRNLTRGEAYSAEAPTVWDVDFSTAVAQAEIEDRDTPGAYYPIAFRSVDSGAPIRVETTRPELLPSCVALVVHPDDQRYRSLVGTKAVSPVFEVEVPVLAHSAAEPEKGSGIAMICTFGDTRDVIWWRECRLPLRVVLQRDGRFQNDVPEWLAGDGAARWSALARKRPEQARAAMADLLREAGALLGEPQPIRHAVKYYEKGDRPLEIVTSRQWYIRNGANDPELRERLMHLGDDIAWHPDFMRVRYQHWVSGLNTDWLISRQRYFGVPFPVWYPLDEHGQADWDRPLTPDEDTLPIDPQIDVPPGYSESQRGQPGGFGADPDVMDTWATSSLTPQIVCGWLEDEERFAQTFPMDLRPQGPEIIRTWLFSSVLRAELEQERLPWSNAFINGWIVDPDRKKMSKSKGNVITPEGLVNEFGADGLRYWACRAGPGADTVMDTAQIRNGRRLAIKVLNASRFVLGVSPEEVRLEGTPEPIDRALLSRLARTVDEAGSAFECYNYHQSLAAAETFFWQFCDDYIELVKDRAYEAGPSSASARWTLRTALRYTLQLLAPILPFVTEEVWSWWQEGSIHRSPWPDPEPLQELADTSAEPTLDLAVDILNAVRRAKTMARQSLRSPVQRVTVLDRPDRLAAARSAEGDVRRAGHIEELVLRESAVPEIEVDLAAAAVDGDGQQPS
jgi:valyl-tRNA synthetase